MVQTKQLYEIKMEKIIYQIRYCKGSYDSFTTWCSDELYETKELAQEVMEKFKEENSLEILWKKMKLSTREDWGPDYELPSIYVVDYKTVPNHLNMTMDEFLEAIRDDMSLFYDYLCPYEQYNYDNFEVIERKLIYK